MTSMYQKKETSESNQPETSKHQTDWDTIRTETALSLGLLRDRTKRRTKRIETYWTLTFLVSWLGVFFLCLYTLGSMEQ